MSVVSVIVPTFNRPRLLLRAIDSVLSQTHRQFELLVVVDRPDPETVKAVQSVDDPRVRLVTTPHPLTAAGARNAGADQATGEWVAFLDDDDEWLPNKLAMQITLASRHPSTLVSCLSRVETPTGTYVRPKTVYDNSGPLDEYLFDRRTLFGGASFMQTSSYLLRHSLFDKVRFDANSAHDDWDFLLRLSKHEGTRIETVPEVLVVLHFEEQRPTLTTRTSSWMRSLRYLDKIQPIITRRSYSGYCLGVVGERAAQEQAYAAFFQLLDRAFRNGSPRLLHVLPYLAYWLIPLVLLRRLRAVSRNPRRLYSAVRENLTGGMSKELQ